VPELRHTGGWPKEKGDHQNPCDTNIAGALPTRPRHLFVFVNGSACVSKRTVDPEAISEQLARQILAAQERKMVGARRPNIEISKVVERALRLALDRAGGQLILGLTDAVKLLQLSPSYEQPERAFLLAGSLGRKLGDIAVGTRQGGRYLSFTVKR
jgi:hypothetical protein